MKEYVIIILAVIGLTSGLQAGYEYKYKYFGSIATGISELSSQAAGVAIRCDVTIQLRKDGIALVQFTEVEITEFNDKLGCDLRGDVPGKFGPIQNEAFKQIIQVPFEAHLYTPDATTLVVAKHELMWVTNIRKAIVSIFYNQILKANFEAGGCGEYDKIASYVRKGHIIPEFKVLEETIFGKCQVEYTIHKLPEYLAGPRSRRFEKTMELDCQRAGPKKEDLTKKETSKTSKKQTTKTKSKTSPEKLIKEPIRDDLWHVARSVNFDHCEDLVAMQFTPLGVSESMSENQYEWLRGRSSVAEYILRGSGGAMRVERVAVEGATNMAPFGIASGFLEARSNQTYQLVSACETRNPLSIPIENKLIKTWMQSVESHVETPKINKVHKWINYSGSGLKQNYFQPFGADHLTAEETKQTKVVVVQAIEAASKLLADLDQTHEIVSGEAINHLNSAAYHMKFLSKDEILEIFHSFGKKDTHSDEVLATSLTLDAASVAGTADGVRAILQAIKEDNVPYFKIFSIAMTLTTNLNSPEAIPDILDYVMSIKIREKPFLAATVYANFANLLHQMCISPKAMEVYYPGNFYGDHTCKNFIIKARFEPFLRGIIHNPDSRTWERKIAMAALLHLGTPYLIPAIRSIILGQAGFEVSNSEREFAMCTLDSYRLHEHKSSHVGREIIAMLNEVFSNVGEDPGVRQAALLTLSTWEIEPNFWHRLARTSWREPSKQMASYITTFIEGVANSKSWKYVEQSQGATQALRYARPVAPSCKYSSIYINSKKIVDQHVSMFQMFEWLNHEQNPGSVDVYLLFLLNIGGFEFTNLEFYLSSDAFKLITEDLMAIMNNKEQEPIKFDGIAAKVAKQYFDKIQESIGGDHIRSKEKYLAHSELDIYLRVFEHMILFLPINVETLNKLPFADKTSLAKLFVQLTLGYDLNVVKFLSPIVAESFHATDVGLPLFAAASSPMVFSEVCNSKLGVGGKDLSSAMKKLQLTSECFLRFASQASSSLAVFVPWTKSFILTFLKSDRDVTVPLTAMIKHEHVGSDELGHQKLTHFDFQSNFIQNFYVLRASNSPFTSIIPLSMSPSSRKPIVKPIFSSIYPIVEDRFDLPQVYTGLDFEVTWASEIPFPLNLLDIGSLASSPEKIASQPWLMYALASPTLKAWKLDVLFKPESSETQKVNIDLTIGICGAKKKEDDQISQFGQDIDFDQYAQEGEDFTQGVQKPDSVQSFQDKDDASAEVETGSGAHFSHGESFKQRVVKLQEYHSGPSFCISVKFLFEGKTPRNYEILHTFSKSSHGETRKIKKWQIALFRGPVPGRDSKPLSVCLDTVKSMPKFNPLDTYESLAASNLDSDLSAELTIGCTGKPVATLKGNYKLTSKAKTVLFDEVKQACDYDKYDPLLSFHRHAVYDEVNCSFEWEKVCDLSQIPFLTTTFDYIERILSVHLQKTKCNNLANTQVPGKANIQSINQSSNKKLTLQAHRDPRSNEWHLKLKQDDSEISLDRPKFGNLLNEYFTLRHHTHASYKYPKHLTTHGMEATICSVGVNSVRTFDGYTYDYKPSKCWRVAAKDCQHPKHGAVLLVRSSHGESTAPEVRYIGDRHQFTVEVEKGGVRVNGKVIEFYGDSEEVTDKDGNVLVTVFKKNGHSLIKIGKKFAFAVKDRVEISFPNKLEGMTCGLCGDFNGEPEVDLVGPHGCYYDDPDTFAAAWTAGSETCDVYELLELRETADKFQTTCKTISSVDTLHKAIKYSNFCTSYGYKIKTFDPNLVCLSSDPIPYCEGECLPFENRPEHVKFQCWTKNLAPEGLLEALAKGDQFLKTLLPVDFIAPITKVDILTLPSGCRNFGPQSGPLILPPPGKPSDLPTKSKTPVKI